MKAIPAAINTFCNRVIFYSGVAVLVTLVIIGALVIFGEWTAKKIGLLEAAP